MSVGELDLEALGLVVGGGIGGPSRPTGGYKRVVSVVLLSGEPWTEVERWRRRYVPRRRKHERDSQRRRAARRKRGRA